MEEGVVVPARSRQRKEPRELRTEEVMVRLTVREAAGLDAIRHSHGGTNRAEMIRQLMKFQVARAVPEINQAAFAKLAQATETLLVIQELIERQPTVIDDAEALASIRNRFAEIRGSLLGLP